ncbi:MAG: hypothetical protein JST47_03530 [Bacteroidetes bacterium]|nr:hypothetical protein [Bacteroidota bacterium]MBS1975436.1 hypothetical protein [Bacteroidota bacterium]
MKKLNLANARQLSKTEMKKIMAGSGGGQCSTPYGCAVGLHCNLNCGGNLTIGTCSPMTNYGPCVCYGAC